MKLQQGDVILRPTKEDFSKGEKQNHLVIMEGEATGHNHQVVSGVAALILLKEKKFLEVFSKSVLKHQEHETIEIPVGKYEINRKREYDHFEEEAREVAD